MTEKIRFTKMHGCGNDYIYINMMEYDIADPQAAAIAWSDRHKGIGSDGLVLIDRSAVPEADFSMRIFNADGSEAMMCGNASRCIGKYLYERGLTDKTEIRLLTLSGVKTLQLHVNNGNVESVTVDMLEPKFEECILLFHNVATSSSPVLQTTAASAPACGKGVAVSRWLVEQVPAPQPLLPHSQAGADAHRRL